MIMIMMFMMTMILVIIDVHVHDDISTDGYHHLHFYMSVWGPGGTYGFKFGKGKRICACNDPDQTLAR